MKRFACLTALLFVAAFGFSPPPAHRAALRAAKPTGRAVIKKAHGFTLRLTGKVHGRMSTVTLTSTPASFSYGPGTVNVLFSIPSGVWTSGTWEIVGGCIAVVSFTTGGAHTASHACSGDVSTAVITTQLTDINAAAGSSLAVAVGSPGPSHASAFTLTLIGTLAADHCGISPAVQVAVIDTATGLYTVTLYDSNSQPIAAPIGGQVFTLTDGDSGTFIL